MKLDKLTGKFARWTLLLEEYDYQMVHCARITNLDANGLHALEVLRMRIWPGLGGMEIVIESWY